MCFVFFVKSYVETFRTVENISSFDAFLNFIVVHLTRKCFQLRKQTHSVSVLLLSR